MRNPCMRLTYITCLKLYIPKLELVFASQLTNDHAAIAFSQVHDGELGRPCRIGRPGLVMHECLIQNSTMHIEPLHAFHVGL